MGNKILGSKEALALVSPAPWSPQGMAMRAQSLPATTLSLFTWASYSSFLGLNFSSVNWGNICTYHIG